MFASSSLFIHQNHLAMQANLGTAFPTPIESQNGHFTSGITPTNNENRSQSRSTDGTDTTDGNQSANEGSTVSSPHQPITNLNMALQHVENNSNPFPTFNQADLLNFHNNALIPHQMFSQFGRYPNVSQSPLETRNKRI
ncbi:unnamed protein product [Caenorhabditis bovis]|uniref:Uncharacterized protein n=1 Tax=Caenorhabditis bovis TaxID=2654633 RepID=A0A8S1EYM3_9PELO|nr:unnamed protein product [Caenorhabditis bovis]